MKVLLQCNGENNCLFNTWPWNTWIYIREKINLDSYNISYPKINPGCIVDLKVKGKTFLIEFLS